MLRSKGGWSIIILFLLSALVLGSSYISPEAFWPSSFFVLALIPVLILNLLVLFFLLFKRSVSLVFPLLILVAGLRFLPKFYAWPTDDAQQVSKSDFRVVSYNTSFFRVGGAFTPGYYSADKNLLALQINDWIRTNGADIICLQEFFDDKNSDIFNNVQTIGEQGGYRYHFLNRPQHDNGIGRGLIVFSKFPIVHHGDILLSDNRYNGAMFVDLEINQDTVRVINLHLESLSLSERAKNKTLLWVIKNNAVQKCQQARAVIDEVRSSPYPTIVCGDFNEVPNGFIYRQFDQQLKNAFEEKGQGGGLTYQGSYPIPLLRIDNQFYDPAFQLVSFATHYSIGYSDHFPIEARYRIP